MMRGAGGGYLGLELAEMGQQRPELVDVLCQGPLLAFHFPDEHFELEDFDSEAPGQIVWLTHRPRLRRGCGGHKRHRSRVMHDTGHIRPSGGESVNCTQTSATTGDPREHGRPTHIGMMLTGARVAGTRYRTGQS
jgi:hypothetical protein